MNAANSELMLRRMDRDRIVTLEVPQTGYRLLPQKVEIQFRGVDPTSGLEIVPDARDVTLLPLDPFGSYLSHRAMIQVGTIFGGTHGVPRSRQNSGGQSHEQYRR